MKNGENIRLVKVKDEDLNKVLEMINNDQVLKETFSGGRNTINRLLDSIYTAYIKANNRTVGFVMIVNNSRTNKNEIDMGVLSNYRNKGYGTKALELLKKVIILNKLNIEVQIKKSNKAAIQSVLKNGFVLCREDKYCNYYTITESSKLRM